MSCPDASSQMAYSDAQGQSSLSQVLSPEYRPSASSAALQTPYTLSQVLLPDFSPRTSPAAQQAGPYAAPGGLTTQRTGSGTLADQVLPITPMTQPQAMTLESLQYLNGALRTQIGSRVTVSFLIGTNTFQDRTGTLLAVGANYIIINETETDDILFCDYYTIKFVKVYR